MRKIFTAPDGGAISEPVSKPEEKYLSTIRQVFKNVRVPTETIVLKVFSRRLRL
ncbi:hypothetical protein LEP1GSC137_0431 [Leptospira borgpetersenii str. Noumea 25]|nr:hypothetical protein LEP1GSC137_0431 [Leptospira borgpetersenii str. Noumea 25]